MVKDQGVSTKLNREFFDNIFEPERRKLEFKTGMKISQLQFTEFLAKKKVQFKFPKQNIPKIKIRKPIKRGFSLI